METKSAVKEAYINPTDSEEESDVQSKRTKKPTKKHATKNKFIGRGCARDLREKYGKEIYDKDIIKAMNGMTKFELASLGPIIEKGKLSVDELSQRLEDFRLDTKSEKKVIKSKAKAKKEQDDEQENGDDD